MQADIGSRFSTWEGETASKPSTHFGGFTLKSLRQKGVQVGMQKRWESAALFWWRNVALKVF